MTKKAKLKLNAYRVISDTIREALPSGLWKYFKYRETFDVNNAEDVEQMVEHLHNYVMVDLDEVIDWGDE